MTIPNLGPERLPTDLGAPAAGRYAAMRKIRDAHKEAKASTNPDDLLTSGVFIPSIKE